jgi:hypothetical protein
MNELNELSADERTELAAEKPGGELRKPPKPPQPGYRHGRTILLFSFHQSNMEEHFLDGAFGCFWSETL